jgi:hypothetical protein
MWQSGTSMVTTEFLCSVMVYKDRKHSAILALVQKIMKGSVSIMAEIPCSLQSRGQGQRISSKRWEYTKAAQASNPQKKTVILLKHTNIWDYFTM